MIPLNVIGVGGYWQSNSSGFLQCRALSTPSVIAWKKPGRAIPCISNTRSVNIAPPTVCYHSFKNDMLQIWDKQNCFFFKVVVLLFQLQILLQHV